MRQKGEGNAGGADIVLVPLGIAPESRPGTRPLVGGPLAFSHLRAILTGSDGQRSRELVPVTGFDSWAASLPSPMAARAIARMTALTTTRPPLALADGRLLRQSGRPLVMGILNVTPDSFSDGGRFAAPDQAVAHARAMIAAGADIIDIGGESTRPGATPLWPEEEIARILPVISALADARVPLSVDTRHAAVMEAALDAGAAIINDVSALSHDPESLALMAERRCPLVLMHARGDPRTMQDNPVYEDVLGEVFAFLEGRLRACEAAGIPRQRLIVDPGIGFGKTVRHNLTLINRIAAFHGLGVPVLLGASRKRFIGALAQEERPDHRLAGSLAVALAAVDKGVQILRVHDVAETVQALAVHQGLQDARLLEEAAAADA
ncbi:MAG: dihydropteroate synthase, partial [Rhodothalassiaceae bacterium]